MKAAAAPPRSAAPDRVLAQQASTPVSTSALPPPPPPSSDDDFTVQDSTVGYIDSPVLTGIDVKFEGFDVYDVEPGTVPDLFASRPIVVFGKWRGAAVGSIELLGNTGRGPYRASVPVSSANLDASHGALRYLSANMYVLPMVANAPPNIVRARKRGDSLHAIAFKFSLDWREIARLNGISSPYVIYPDQMLKLGVSPQASTVSQPGEPGGVRIAAAPPPSETATRALETPALNHRFAVTGGVLEAECRDLIQQFFREKRRSERDAGVAAAETRRL